MGVDYNSGDTIKNVTHITGVTSANTGRVLVKLPSNIGSYVKVVIYPLLCPARCPRCSVLQGHNPHRPRSSKPSSMENYIGELTPTMLSLGVGEIENCRRNISNVLQLGALAE